MGKVETDEMRARRGQEIVRRSDRVLVAIMRIELHLSDLDPLDKLIAHNECLKNVIHDGSGGR
jgi:hypothetical protein